MNFNKRIVLLGIIDITAVVAAVFLSYLVRFDFQIESRFLHSLPYVIASQAMIIPCVFHLNRIYRRIWRYAGIRDLLVLVKAIVVSEGVFFLMAAAAHLILPSFIIPRSIYLLIAIFIFIGIGGSRILSGIFKGPFLRTKQCTEGDPTLIIGAGLAGVLVSKELKTLPNKQACPVAFVDDDPAKWKLEVEGLPVLGGRERIPEIVDAYNVKNIVIAMPSVSPREIAKIIDICKNTTAQVKTLPRVSDLISEKFSINMIRKVSVEDLLGREPVSVDLKGIADYVNDKVVLVTGAGGSIGSELCRQISLFAPRLLLLLGHGENSIFEIEMEIKNKFPDQRLLPIIADIQDRQRMQQIFKRYRPSVVFHAAAHKHVPLMEHNPVAAIKNNILGTKNVAQCADTWGSTLFVMVSTDKAVNPTSVMGVTKKIAEMFVQGLNHESKTKFVTVRFGNVLASRGSVIPIFEKQISQGGPVTVTHPDMVRYFMTIREAAQLVIQAGAISKGGEIFVLDMGKPVKIVDLARDLIKLSGMVPEEDIEITYTGIRPGEKLYEETLTNAEEDNATQHDRIFIGKPESVLFSELKFRIQQLENIVVRKDSKNRDGEIQGLLHQIVPTYHNTFEDRINSVPNDVIH